MAWELIILISACSYRSRTNLEVIITDSVSRRTESRLKRKRTEMSKRKKMKNLSHLNQMISDEVNSYERSQQQDQISNMDDLGEEELLASSRKPYKRPRLGSDQHDDQVLIEKAEERKTDEENIQ